MVRLPQKMLNSGFSASLIFENPHIEASVCSQAKHNIRVVNLILCTKCGFCFTAKNVLHRVRTAHRYSQEVRAGLENVLFERSAIGGNDLTDLPDWKIVVGDAPSWHSLNVFFQQLEWEGT